MQKFFVTQVEVWSIIWRKILEKLTKYILCSCYQKDSQWQLEKGVHLHDKNNRQKHLNTTFLVGRGGGGRVTYLAASCEMGLVHCPQQESSKWLQDKTSHSLDKSDTGTVNTGERIPTIFKSGPRLHSTLWYCDQALSRQDWEQYCTSQQRRHLRGNRNICYIWKSCKSKSWLRKWILILRSWKMLHDLVSDLNTHALLNLWHFPKKSLLHSVQVLCSLTEKELPKAGNNNHNKRERFLVEGLQHMVVQRSVYHRHGYYLKPAGDQKYITTVLPGIMNMYYM